MKKRVECECGWVLETDDEEKLVKGVQEHASEVHHMQGVTREQVLAQAKPAKQTAAISGEPHKESSVKYLYLLYADESKMPAPGTPAFNAQNDAFNNYFAEIDGKGMFKAGDPVQASKTSKTVRVRNGHTEATSGPFVKTGDQLVGFYVIEAKDLDEAVAYAAKCPVASVGAMEVRPIVQM